MENRHEHVLLMAHPTSGIAKSIMAGMALVALAGNVGAAENSGKPVQVIEPDITPREITQARIDSEFFELGVFAGVLSIDNFSTEPVYGVSAAFHATEDFFLQFNYGMSEAGLTSFEELGGANIRLLTDSDRDYTFYNFLVGYNIFPGEVFFSDKLTFNSAFYLVAGVGNTEFGGENNFTTTIGTGFRIVPLDWVTFHVDFRNHMFQSDLIRESQLTHNIQLSTGITVFF
ncbi:outer membrane beta-barrel domain-containing protein [Marinobacter sp.]|uniref:outer membrane beta-barrel domain-containing protein n=1 Tax=Marinobacter sp. TaxID=50741 RepID=UPI0019EEC0FE|nr:outer membrane beta-barrel domain-containing protein [Marinobacter sp.]MBE0486588.1 outer membrane beta-barrel domain-containing protein [Marinobacter sp.]